MKQTPLAPCHVALGAKMGPFGGWMLPIYYSSILEEHAAVRSAVGLFDVSHLGHLEVSGDGAVKGLEPLFTRDLSRLSVGQACYTPMLREDGSILDEMILYRLGENRVRFVVNAANADGVLQWLRSHVGGAVAVQDLREAIGTLALQGPKAAQLLAQVSSSSFLSRNVPPEGGASDRFSALPLYGILEGKVTGRPAWIARTGYTGEDGFELFLKADDLQPVWDALLEKGKPFGIRPIGLGARDTLRLEAGLPLGGADLDPKTTPLEAGLDWTVCWTKEFIGKQALVRQKQQGLTRRLVGFILQGPGIPRHGYPIFWKGEKAGQVTSGTLLPDRRAIGLGYVPPEATSAGTQLQIEIHDRQVPAEVVQLPFYSRPRGHNKVIVSPEGGLG